MQRRRRGVGWSVEGGRRRGRKTERGQCRLAVAPTGRQTIELGIADERGLARSDHPCLDVAAHPVRVDERHAIVVMEIERETDRIIEIVLAGDAMREIDPRAASPE